MNEQVVALLLFTGAASGMTIRLSSLTKPPKHRLLLWMESLVVAAPALMLAAMRGAGASIVAVFLTVGFLSGWWFHRRFSGLRRGKGPR